MKGEQTMKKVNLNEYAAICRAARRGNLIAKMRLKNVEVDNDNELVKLVAESLKKSSDFFATLCCTDPNVGTTALGQWAEGVWKSKERWQELVLVFGCAQISIALKRTNFRTGSLLTPSLCLFASIRSRPIYR